MSAFTILRKSIKSGNFVAIEKDELTRLEKENAELRLAFRAVLAGELALRQGKTRSFKEFLKDKSPRYVKNK